MATRATFQLPPSVDVHQWIRTNFPGIADYTASRTAGLVVVEIPQDVSAAGKAAAEAAVLDAWTTVTWESIP